MGNSLALYNPPTRVAEEFAMIDCISGGRLIAGFPVGTPMDTCYAYGQNPSMLRDRYYEAHDLVMRAWQERDTFAFSGRFNQQRYVNIWPRPVQRFRIRRCGSPAAARLKPGSGAREWTTSMRIFHTSATRMERRRWTGSGARWLAWARTVIRIALVSCNSSAWPSLREKAWELYREPAEYFYGRCLHVDPMWATPPGYITEATQRAGVESQIGRAASSSARSRQRATEMQDIVDMGYVIIGSPDEVAEQLTEVATSLNVGHLMLLLQYGNMNKELTKYNTKLFAEAVMPKLKPLFSEWEDRWWPQPMESDQRADVPAFVPGLAAE